MKRLLTVCGVLVITGCTTTKIYRYVDIDTQKKSMTVPAGSRQLKGALKQVLIANGWTLAIDRGPSRTQGTGGENVNLQHYDTFKTEYRLIANWRQFDVCFNSSPAINYEISVISNSTGVEAFTLNGKDCLNEVVKRFEEAINNKNQPTPVYL